MARFLCLFVALLALNVSAATDWPTFRGPNRNGIATDKGINKDWKTRTPKELWRVKVGDNGFSGPAVAAGKLFIIDKTGDEDVVRAISITTGQDVWSFKYPDAYKPDVANWGRGRSTPTYENGKLYTQGASGMLHCLDAEKGTEIWKRNIQADFGGRWQPGQWWGYTAAPMIDGNALIVSPGGENACMVALDKNTGKDIWKGGGSDFAGYSTPVIATIEGKKQYVTMTGNAVIGVDASNGALLWRQVWKTSYFVNASDVIVVNNFVFAASAYGFGCGLIKIEGGQPTLVWSNKEIQAQFNAPILIGEHLYGTSGQADKATPDDVLCMDMKTGNVLWKNKGFECGGLVAVEDVLIAVHGKFGDVAMFKASPTGYAELGRFKPLNGRSWTPPIVADGKLFVRDMKELACYDLK